MARWTDRLVQNLSKEHQTRKKANKYSAEKATFGGHSFASKLEAEVFAMLKLQERAGLLKNIRTQVAIDLIGDLRLKVDFVVFEIKRGIDIAVEAKGFETERWVAIRQAWVGCGPMPIQVWKKQGTRLFMEKEIQNKRTKINERD